MAASWRASVQPVVAEIMAARAIPGVVVAVAQGDRSPERLVAGADGAGRPLAANSILIWHRPPAGSIGST